MFSDQYHSINVTKLHNYGPELLVTSEWNFKLTLDDGKYTSDVNINEENSIFIAIILFLLCN